MWNVLRQLLPSSKKCSVSEDNAKTKIKAYSFNDFFANVGKDTYEESQRNTTGHSDDLKLNLNTDALPYDVFRPQPIDRETIILEIKHLKNTSSWDLMIYHSDI